MIKKFKTYNDFVDFINKTGKVDFISVRAFLFFHVIYTIENPEAYTYYFDPFNTSSTAEVVWYQIKYLSDLIHAV